MNNWIKQKAQYSICMTLCHRLQDTMDVASVNIRFYKGSLDLGLLYATINLDSFFVTRKSRFGTMVNLMSAWLCVLA